MKAAVISVFVLLGILLGVIAATLGGPIALIAFVPILPIVFILHDYRVGVVCLTILLPLAGSKLLPQTSGFNIVQYLVAATLFAFIIQRVFRHQAIVGVPRVFRWCYLLPITIGMLVAWPRTREALQGVAIGDTKDLDVYQQPLLYMKQWYIKPLQFVIYAVLLANAVRDSKRPERFVVPLVLSALLPSFIVIGRAATYGASLSILQGDRNFLTSLGMHANEFGWLLAMATGPLLFLAGAAHGWRRWGYGVALAIVTLGLTLTFSRGAFVGLLVTVVAFVVYHRRFRVAFVVVTLALIAAALAPDAVVDRLTTGMGSGEVAGVASNMQDKLTAGRVASWTLLAPEILHSPIWGNGIGSTLWNTAVKAGRYFPNHPHNLYLEIALDLGLLGFVALMVLAVRIGRTYFQLARTQTLPDTLRTYFAGAGAALLGMALMAVTSGHYMPRPEQTYFWFSLGMAFAYWPSEQRATQRRPARAHFIMPGGAAGRRPAHRGLWLR